MSVPRNLINHESTGTDMFGYSILGLVWDLILDWFLGLMLVLILDPLVFIDYITDIFTQPILYMVLCPYIEFFIKQSNLTQKS